MLFRLLLFAFNLFLHFNKLLQLHAFFDFLVASSALFFETLLLDALALEVGKFFVFFFPVLNIVFSFFLS